MVVRRLKDVSLAVAGVGVAVGVGADVSAGVRVSIGVYIGVGVGAVVGGADGVGEGVRKVGEDGRAGAREVCALILTESINKPESKKRSS